MAVAYYRDPSTNEWVPLGGPTGPSGAAGPPGAPGPTVVSNVTGNAAVLGSDGLPFVPGIDTTAMDSDYVNLTGDTMTGELLLPDPAVAPPTAPAEVAARGYVDQVTTVSDVGPTLPPARGNLVWFVVEDVVAVSGKITLTYAAAANAGFTVSGAYTVDWGDGSALESFAAGAQASHSSPGAVVIEPQAGQSLTSFILTPAATSPTGIVFDSTALVDIQLNSSRKLLEQVEFRSPVVLDSCSELFRGQRQLLSVTGSIASSGTDFSYMFAVCTSLQTIPDLDTSNGTNFEGMFALCLYLESVPPYDTANGTNFMGMFMLCIQLTTGPSFTSMAKGVTFSGMFMYCLSLVSTPPYDMSAGVDFDYMFYSTGELASIGTIQTSACETVDSMFMYCSALTAAPMLTDTSKCTNFENMFYRNGLLTSVPAYDMSGGTSAASFDGIFESSTAMTSVLMHGAKYSFKVVGALQAPALDVLFTNLGTAVAGETVTITGNPGAATCNRAIATAKGWTVTE